MLRPFFFACTFPRDAHSPAVSDLKRSLRLFDGLAMVVGIMVGSGIFRTPGLVAAHLGRPWLTFVAWVLGGALAFLGALCFAELATRHPRAGGKYVYVREACGPRDRAARPWRRRWRSRRARCSGRTTATPTPPRSPRRW